MKLHHTSNRSHGLTVMETLVILAILLFLIAMILQHLAMAKRHRGPWCTSNLKQLALAMRVWAGDNNDRFPMQISVTNGGAMELTGISDGLKVFQVMSNELSTPRIILCPQDSLHQLAATNFTTDLTNKVSYFIGMDATAANPQSILSGDDNFLFNQSPVHPGLINVTSPAQLEWDGERHGTVVKRGWFTKVKKLGVGNIVFADGSVDSIRDSGLTNYLGQTGFATNRLVIP